MELYNMPVPLRKFYAQKLIEAKNKESQTIKEAEQGKRRTPNFQKS
jgi:hypothetical protein